MDFNKKSQTIKNILFYNYDISTRLKEEDWKDDADNMAMLLSDVSDENKVVNEYTTYLQNTFKDDQFTDFTLISKKIYKALNA